MLSIKVWISACQVNVKDPAKAGLLLQEVDDFIGGSRLWRHQLGLMTITALDATAQQTRQWFDILAGKFAALSQKPLPENTEMRWLSMGMWGI